MGTSHKHILKEEFHLKQYIRELQHHGGTVLAHQKAVQFFHPAAQQQKGNNPAAKTAYQQRQRIKIIPQNSRCRANDRYDQKDKGADTCAAVV